MGELSVGRVLAEASHPELGVFEAAVEDLSLHGMRLVVLRADETGLVLAGDRLDSVRVIAGSDVLYTGNAQVRRVSDDDERLVLGIELSGSGVNLDVLYRMDGKHTIGERLQAAIHGSESVPSDFKAWIADLRGFLEATKECLDKEESALADWDRWTREEAVRDYVDEAAPVVSNRLNRAAIELGDFVSSLDEEDHATHRTFYRRHLSPYYHRSALLNRAFHKPLGYAGDYEMMNILYREHAEGDSLFAKVMNVYACQEAAGQAVVNRREFLAERILAALDQCGQERLRIANIGCGPAEEIRSLLSAHPSIGHRLEIALIDQEERALRYCQRTLAPLAAQTGARIDFIDGSIRRLLIARSLSQALGTRDFVYSAGLFDYLGERSFTTLLAALYEALAPDGELLIGNMSLKANTSKWFMEYISDWHLIHRTEAQLLDLAGSLAPTPRSTSVIAEPAGVNLFLHIRR